MEVYWEKAAGIKNYLRMKGLEQRGSSIPQMFNRLAGELADLLGNARLRLFDCRFDLARPRVDR